MVTSFCLSIRSFVGLFVCWWYWRWRGFIALAIQAELACSYYYSIGRWRFQKFVLIRGMMTLTSVPTLTSSALTPPASLARGRGMLWRPPVGLSRAQPPNVFVIFGHFKSDFARHYLDDLYRCHATVNELRVIEVGGEYPLTRILRHCSDCRNVTTPYKL